MSGFAECLETNAPQRRSLAPSPTPRACDEAEAIDLTCSPAQNPVAAPATKEPWSCARGFSEAQWNEAYALWKQATVYDSGADSDYKQPNKKVGANPNGELSLADAMELDFSLPDDVPEYFQNILAKYSHANKKSRRSYSFTQKLALLNWIDYHRGEDEKPNWSQASKKTGIDRKTLREWDKDRDIINKQVQDVKKLGSSKKYGGSANRKRIRLQTPLHSEIERELLVYFDTRDSFLQGLKRFHPQVHEKKRHRTSHYHWEWAASSTQCLRPLRCAYCRYWRNSTESWPGTPHWSQWSNGRDTTVVVDGFEKNFTT